MTDAIDPAFGPLVQFMEEGIPFNLRLGLRVRRLTRGECVLTVPWKDDLVGDPLRPAVHGGVLSALIDTAGGLACFSMLGGHEDRVSTVDLRVDYLRPSAGDDFFCHASVVRMGNRVAVARMEVTAGQGSEAIATGQAVYNVLRRSD